MLGDLPASPPVKPCPLRETTSCNAIGIAYASGEGRAAAARPLKSCFVRVGPRLSDCITSSAINVARKVSLPPSLGNDPARGGLARSGADARAHAQGLRHLYQRSTVPDVHGRHL